MTTIDLEHFRTWIGRSIDDEDVLDVRHARLMAATLGLDQLTLLHGAPLPPLWHWLYFLQGLPPNELGPDSHPARGSFLPPVPLGNRMWAGGQLTFHCKLPLGAQVSKRSQVVAVDHKRGRSGDLVFVTVQHDVLHAGQVAVSELHNIVFKEPSPSQTAAPPTAQPRSTPAVVEAFTPNSTTLFRYSALTFNGHRIHYDVDYCRETEGYADLVIHGPLTATILAGLAQRVAKHPLCRFEYRGLRPALLGQTLRLEAAPDPIEAQSLLLYAVLADGTVCMEAKASF
jgi:3-methylfumaryl-CoA hydratase